MIDANALAPDRSTRYRFSATQPVDGISIGINFSEAHDEPSLPGDCLAAVLDELDYGILLLADGRSRVANINHVARVELDEHHPLRLRDGRLEARLACDAGPLRNAVDAATGRGLRRLLTVGEERRRLTISIVPLGATTAGPAPVLVILGRSVVCGELSMSGFCSSHGLTGAEARVLTELSGGTSPRDMARRLGVAITTVRTHIQSIRAKTGAPSIGALLTRVAILPPLRGVIRHDRLSRVS